MIISSIIVIIYTILSALSFRVPRDDYPACNRFLPENTQLYLSYRHRCKIFWRDCQLQSSSVEKTAEKSFPPFIPIVKKKKLLSTRKRKEKKRNGTEYFTHTFFHLNANISLIISQTKKCFGLKNYFILSSFFLLVTNFYQLERTRVSFAFTCPWFFRQRRYIIFFSRKFYQFQFCGCVGLICGVVCWFWRIRC